ncbi:ATP-binding protein [Streptomyces sp. NPDC004546]|uniref:sensor histidine kinase n=1 Tax=Streptomyces sp. NPDC004546 TaxID=3154282 RepID=UPI0033A9A4B3
MGPDAGSGSAPLTDGAFGQASQVSGRSVPGGVIVFSEVENALVALRSEMVRKVIEAYEQSRLVVRHAMFRHIAQREHLLILKLLEALEALQGQVKAAGLLNEIFRIDNMAVRLRRMVDNLAILGGESASAVRRPVTVTEVLRNAIQAVEQYERARVVHGTHDPQLCLPGHVAPDVTNLVCELVENATMFSAPSTAVWVRTETATAGLIIEVIDRGKSMPKDALDQANVLLASPHLVDVHVQLEDGRLGLLVVGMTAQRHLIHVELSRNPAGGTTALIVIPSDLLVLPEPEPQREFAAQAAAPAQARPEPAPRPAPAAVASASMVGELPRRRSTRPVASLGRAADGLPPLPVRPDAPADFPPSHSSAAGPAAVTENPGLIGAFRQGHQRGLAEDPPQPAPTNSE